MIIYFPVVTTLAMRKIISKQKANDALFGLYAENVVREFKENERQKVYNKMIQSGDFDNLINHLETLAQRKNNLQKKMFRLYKQNKLSSLIAMVENEISIASKKNSNEIKTAIKNN